MGEFAYNPSPEEIHRCEQRWGDAETLLARVMEKVLKDAPEALKKVYGLSDASIVFDYMLTFIKVQHMSDSASIRVTEVVCAAALTKLARSATGTDNDMAQFERNIKDDNH